MSIIILILEDEQIPIFENRTKRDRVKHGGFCFVDYTWLAFCRKKQKLVGHSLRGS